MFYVFATIDWTGARSFKSCVHVPLMLRLVHNVKRKQVAEMKKDLVSFGLVLSCEFFLRARNGCRPAKLLLTSVGSLAAADSI